MGRGDSEAGDLGRDLFTVAEALGHTAMPVRGEGVTPYNTIFWVTERQDHLAPEFGADSRRLRVIAIPEPLLGSGNGLPRTRSGTSTRAPGRSGSGRPPTSSRGSPTACSWWS